MQKKILALAVAGLMSGAAFAQSNVTVYGVVDAGYARASGSEAPVKADERNNRSAMDQGNQAATRLGFRGTEDLGGGLSVGFNLEFGLQGDLGAQNGVLQRRVQTLTLSSNTAGTLAMGRMLNPARTLVTGQDPFQAAGVGSSLNVQHQTTWADNVIAYVSPTFSGFNVVAGFTHDLIGNETPVQKNAQNTTNTKGWVIVPRYTAGPLNVGFSYESFNHEAAVVADQDLKLRRWNLAGSYDFGIARFGATYGSYKQNDTGHATRDADIKQWMLSGWVPVTANGTILVSYNRAKTDISGVAQDRKVSQWALGYNHAMSKRTNAYVTYASLSTNNTAEGRYSVAAHSAGNVTAAPGLVDFAAVAAGTSGYTNGLNIGLRHNF